MKNKTLITVLISFGFLFVIQISVILISIFLQKEKPNDLIGILSGEISFLVVILFLKKYLNISFKKMLVVPRLKVMGFLFLIAGCLIILAPVFVIRTFTIDFLNGYVEGFPFINRMLFSDVSTFFYFIFVGLIGPVLEEIYYRKIILSELNKKYNSFWSILISSLLFSIYHMDYEQIQGSFFFGIIAGYIYLKTKNIFVVICIHMLFNLSTMALNTRFYPLEGINYMYPFFYLLLIFGMLFFIKKIVVNLNDISIHKQK